MPLRRTLSILLGGGGSGKGNEPVSFQFMSDLHLEIGKQYLTFQFPVSAPYLILAGDIGCLVDYELYHKFLELQCKRFKQVFLVLGNHEFYGLSREEGLRFAKRLEQDPALNGKLALLDRHQVNLDYHPDVAILGCTLQSYITPGSRASVKMKVQDFRKIEGWTVDDHNAEHTKDSDWLEKRISTIRSEENGSKRKILVVTHHAPCSLESSDPSNVGSDISSAFATNLLEGEDNVLSKADCWIFGHTHYTTDFVKSGVRVVSNQRGYVLSGTEHKIASSKSIWQHAVSYLAKSVSDDRFTFDSSKTLSL